MAQSVEQSRTKLIGDFNAVIQDTEELLRSLAATGAEKGDKLRAAAEENLRTARVKLRQLQADAAAGTHAAAEAADEYVRENPWQSVGIAAAVAALVGLVLGLLLTRR